MSFNEPDGCPEVPELNDEQVVMCHCGAQMEKESFWSVIYFCPVCGCDTSEN